MTNLVLVFICLVIGFVAQQLKLFPPQAATTINRFVINISLPALTLKLMHSLTLDSTIIYPLLMPWILFILGFVFFNLFKNVFSLNRDDLGSLILTASLGNTSFVGFALLEAYFGKDSLSTGILIDQPGTFFIAGTLGIATASYYSGTTHNARDVLKKVFVFPPFLALIIAISTQWAVFPLWLNQTLDRLGGTLMPLALVAVGLQLHFDKHIFKKHYKKLCLGLGFKLIVSPLFFIFLYSLIFQQRGELIRITIIEAAMAPMITAGIIACEHKLNPELSNLMIGIGIPLSLLTTYCWLQFLNATNIF